LARAGENGRELIFAHDLIRKPPFSFRDHAPGGIEKPG
jgi:hypothetical protein